ncbi:glycine hydroxymethyltransferase [Nematocida ausubeli]|nr:glycine hydroxymethyltransferase [Nematocida ausubeli]
MSVEQDSQLKEYVDQEENRQRNSLTLIASENYVFPEIYKYSGSLLTNKYSEGKVGARYYGGTKYIDAIESLCQKRALALFGLDPNEWGVCVQPYSGSVANFSAYSALIGPGGKIMGMNLPAGGHLTHGFQTKTRKVSGTSLYFASYPYEVDEKGVLDYSIIEKQVNEINPELLICGYSAHSQDINYQKLRSIIGSNAFLYADISHISALIACNLMNSPFAHCDVVMTTTHKGLRGPRGAIIIYRKSVTIKGKEYNLEQRMHQAVFPLMQGGPHNQTIAGIAHAMHMAAQPEFKKYGEQVLANSKVMCKFFQEKGYNIITGSTVNHMIIIDLGNMNVGGQEVETFCDSLGISINKNSVPRDKGSLFTPSGIRLGTYALTTRGFKEDDIVFVAGMIDSVISLLKETAEERKGYKTLEAWMQEKNILQTSSMQRIIQQVSYFTQVFQIPE